MQPSFPSSHLTRTYACHCSDRDETESPPPQVKLLMGWNTSCTLEATLYAGNPVHTSETHDPQLHLKS